MGKITEPRPLMIRVPRKPYTTRASCGPALRYSRANMAIRNMRVNAISPAMAKIISMLIVLVLLNFVCGCRRIRKLIPWPDIGNAALVAGHNDFGSLCDFDFVIDALLPRAARRTPACEKIISPVPEG